MSTHKHIDKICLAVLALVILITICLMNGESLGLQASDTSIGYETKLFDSSKIHTIDIIMEDWDSFIETAQNEEYAQASIVINQEAYKNVGIRAKGNSSLSSVASSDSNRYSFKIEFDQYEKNKSYYGLDKLSLNNIIQDNTFMKDFLSYQMMAAFGVDAPLTSYVYITVNGEDWGLYLAVEGVEDSFLTRNYGNDAGNLYKPDSMDLEQSQTGDTERADPSRMFAENGFDPSTVGGQIGRNEVNDNRFGGSMNAMGGMPGMGSEDVKLQYIDDDPDSYPNIFDNAKTEPSESEIESLIASLKQLSEGDSIDKIVDVDKVIRYFVVHNFVLNFDSYTGSIIHNYYLYENDGVLSMIPWDYNLAFGGFQASSDATSLVNFPIDSPISNGTTEDRPMIHWIFQNVEYTKLYHQYFAEFLDSYFASGIFDSLIDDTIALISPYVEKDPTKFCSYEEFLTAADTLKSFITLRVESIRGQLTGTIPSNRTGQATDSSSLIDASSLSISSMGSMGGKGGMGGHRNENMEGNTQGNIPNMNPDKTLEDEEGSMQDNMGGNKPIMPNNNTQEYRPIIPNDNTQGNRPIMPNGNMEENKPLMPADAEGATGVLHHDYSSFIISIITLLLGLGFIAWYKR